MNGTYLLAAVFAASMILWPEETESVMTAVSLKIQVYWLNWRMKRMARALHKKLSADMKEHYGSELPPFEWVDLWRRDR